MDKRPMLIITVSYIVGILLGLYLEINIALFVLTVVILFVTIYVLSKYILCKKNKIKFAVICVFILVISFTIVKLKEQKFNNVYTNTNQEVEFVGTVVNVQKESNYYYNYIVKIKNFDNKKDFNNINILLKVKKNKTSKMKALEYGDVITGVVELEKPQTSRNYKGYDYLLYLKTKNIYLIGKCESNKVQTIKKNSLYVTNMWISRLRNCFKDNLQKVLPEENASIAIALLLGDSNLISDEQKQIFSEASLSHVLAISGMHVTFVIAGVGFVLKKFDKRRSKYFFIIFLLFFAELTGATPSIIRAVTMSSIMIIAKLVYRKSDTLNNICVACLLILIINPYNILNLGFQLSFFGTLGIVIFNKKIESFFENLKIFTKTNDENLIKKLLKKIQSILSLSISANILIFPILIYTFNIISFTFLVSNILVTPILGIMCFLGYITMIISIISMKLAKIFSVPFNVFLSLFRLLAQFSSNIQFTRFTVVTPSSITIFLYYSIVISIFFFRYKITKKFVLKITTILTIIVIVSNIIVYNNSGLRVYFIDVGQGDSTLIVTSANKTILVDGGGSESGDYDVGKNILVPYLLDRKIMTIDYMIFSHFDSDHCKGLFTVMEDLNVKNTVISKQGEISENYKYFLKLANNKNINIICVKAGNRLEIDKSTYIDILWPDENLIRENVLNNNSIVCKFHHQNISILFTGDIEVIAEKKIVKKYNKEMLHSTILKVAHHGSKSSSIQEFIEMVQPQIALIGVGENNNFGHPNDKVLERLKNIRRIYL